ncbi:MAG: metallophosphoesterase [Holosporales bacterium]|nr:metallophosphoesterase [Holosporales bacterium]
MVKKDFVALLFAVTNMFTDVYAERLVVPGAPGVIAHLLDGPIAKDPFLGRAGMGRIALPSSLPAETFDGKFVMCPTAVKRDINVVRQGLLSTIVRNPRGNNFVLTLSDLHGAFYAYDDIITLVRDATDTILRINPNATLTVLFDGDFSPKTDPILIAELREDARLYPGYFCTHLLAPLQQILGVRVVVVQGNHEAQSIERLYHIARFCKDHNIPFLSPYAPWMRTDWRSVLGKETFFSEKFDNYGVLRDVNPANFVAAQSYYRDGNILVFPHLAACGAYGGENPYAGRYLLDACYDILAYIAGGGTRGQDNWRCGSPEADAIVRQIGATWRIALQELCDNNPGDGPLDIVFASHATNIQTQNFLARMFELCPEARLTEANFPGNSQDRNRGQP